MQTNYPEDTWNAILVNYMILIHLFQSLVKISTHIEKKRERNKERKRKKKTRKGADVDIALSLFNDITYFTNKYH